MVTAASTATRSEKLRVQSTETALGARKTPSTKRTSTPKPAALLATASSVVTGVGEPSYTSGAQKWKGKAAILKPRPAKTSTMEKTTAVLRRMSPDSQLPTTASATSPRRRPPERPNRMLKPKTIRPLASAP